MVAFADRVRTAYLAATDDRLTPPQKYHTVADAEDRLWIPDEYLPLWVENGWRRGR
jgi:hypothetical protein